MRGVELTRFPSSPRYEGASNTAPAVRGRDKESGGGGLRASIAILHDLERAMVRFALRRRSRRDGKGSRAGGQGSEVRMETERWQDEAANENHGRLVASMICTPAASKSHGVFVEIIERRAEARASAESSKGPAGCEEDQ